MKRLSSEIVLLPSVSYGNGKRFNGVEDEQQVDRYRGRVALNGKANDTRERVARDRGIRVAVGRFQPNHKQGKYNTDDATGGSAFRPRVDF